MNVVVMVPALVTVLLLATWMAAPVVEIPAPAFTMTFAPVDGMTSVPDPTVIALMLLVNGLGTLVSHTTVLPSDCSTQLANAACESAVSKQPTRSRGGGKRS